MYNHLMIRLKDVILSKVILKAKAGLQQIVKITI